MPHTSPLSKQAEALRDEITGKLLRHFGKDVKDASQDQLFRACALVLRDHCSARLRESRQKMRTDQRKEVHYLSLEFLLGRSLMKNAFNMGELENLKAALKSMDINPDELFENEPDAGLGNGGLGRLAACFMDSMTTLGLPATGYSICYHFGIFRQKIIEGEQVELPDPWMELGDAWLLPRMDEVEEVRFGGRLVENWEDGKLSCVHEDYTSVLAVPMDMAISGYGTPQVNTLRLWDAKSPKGIDMSLFSRGEYLKALEQNAMAEVIAKVLYPEDNHFEGKLLRLRQQYFFVSATVQSIVRRHRAKYGNLYNFHKQHAIHINDTHPTLVIPELMRIFLDEEHMTWEDAWHIVTHTVAYTNHTVLSEALECWPQQTMEMLLPRLWQILCEINDRYLNVLRGSFPDDFAKHGEMAVIWDGQIRMANLCLYACHAVNGVSELHSEILRQKLFKNQYAMWPDKFKNVTNGVDHRRWLAQINPELATFIRELLGDDAFLTKPEALLGLERFANDASALKRWQEIKRRNKERLAAYVSKTQGEHIDPDSLFDVQAKRLHEYKRQLLNILHILVLYYRLKAGAEKGLSQFFQPRTFFFGAKAASGYYAAKRIIRLISSVAAQVNNDPVCKGRLRVIFLENYRVSLAEILMPATEISEQISLAGKEASGTGNMKFMLNGALTVGTLDGANVEMAEALGRDNIFIFGLDAQGADQLSSSSDYNPAQICAAYPELQAVMDQLSGGFDDGASYGDNTASLLLGAGGRPDPYLVLADFHSYCDVQAEAALRYGDQTRWNRCSMINTARAGRFAADRAISQYAENIWRV